MMLSLREKHEYEYEIAQLKAQLKNTKEELRLSNKREVMWRCRYRAEIGESLSASDRARIIINHSKEKGYIGSVTSECKRIAKLIGLSIGRVRCLWYEKKELRVKLSTGLN